MRLLYEGGVQQVSDLLGNSSAAVNSFLNIAMKTLDVDYASFVGDVRMPQSLVQHSDESSLELNISTASRNFEGRTFFRFKGLDDADSFSENIQNILKTIALSKDTITLSYNGVTKRGELKSEDLHVNDDSLDWISSPEGSLEFIAQNGLKMRSRVELKKESLPSDYHGKFPIVEYDTVAGSNGVIVPEVKISVYGKTKGMKSFIRRFSKEVPMAKISLNDVDSRNGMKVVYEGAIWESGCPRLATKEEQKSRRAEDKKWSSYEKTFDQCFGAFGGHYDSGWKEGVAIDHLKKLSNEGVSADIATGIVMIQYLREGAIRDIHSSRKLMQDKTASGITVFQQKTEENITRVADYLSRAHGENQTLKVKAQNLWNGMPSTSYSSGEYFFEIHGNLDRTKYHDLNKK